MKRFLGIESAPQEEPQETKAEPPKEPHRHVGNMTHSRRNEDMSAEAQLAYFLDTYLYERFPRSDGFLRIERMHNKADQLAGVDVRFTGKDGAVYDVDEKAQLYYLNKNLPTFAFEIEFLREGIPTTGWLCNSTLVTDFYLLIWPYASQDSPKNILWHQFEKAECLLIQKKKLLRMLHELGLSSDRLVRDAAKIRSMHLFGKQAIPGISGIYYYASDPQKYTEAPINLVISKSRLYQIATKTYVVTKDSVVCNEK